MWVCGDGKFDWVIVFGMVLFVLCCCLCCDLVLFGFLCDKVLVIVVVLLVDILVCIGNVVYVCDNCFYGLIMLCNYYLVLVRGGWV